MPKEISLAVVMDRAGELYKEQLRNDRDPRAYIAEAKDDTVVAIPSRQVKALAQALVEEVNKVLGSSRLGGPGE